MKRSILLALLLVAILSLCSITLWGQISKEVERSSLWNLKAVYVVVPPIGREAVKVDYSQKNIQTDAELKLRLAGIRVIESLPSPSDSLQIYITSVKSNGSYAVSVSLYLTQEVLLVRDKRISCIGATWPSQTTIMFGTSRFAEAVREQVKDSMDEFVNDYLSVSKLKVKLRGNL